MRPTALRLRRLVIPYGLFPQGCLFLIETHLSSESDYTVQWSGYGALRYLTESLLPKDAFPSNKAIVWSDPLGFCAFARRHSRRWKNDSDSVPKGGSDGRPRRCNHVWLSDLYCRGRLGMVMLNSANATSEAESHLAR